MRLKTCTRCNQTYPATTQHFGDNLRTLDHLHPYCRDCGRILKAEKRKRKNELSKAWYHANKEKARQVAKESWQRTRRDRLAYLKKYREENRERLNAQARERRARKKLEMMAHNG